MSVAFRRDSDEEHREPRFELPIPPGPNLVTAQGLTLITARITALEVAIAAADDDARAELQRDLRYWQARKASARLTPSTVGEEAGFGSRIQYREGHDRSMAVEIVGHDEADPVAGKIAFSAPLARALIGAAAGDVVEFGGRTLELLDVAPISSETMPPQPR